MAFLLSGGGFFEAIDGRAIVMVAELRSDLFLKLMENSGVMPCVSVKDVVTDADGAQVSTRKFLLLLYLSPVLLLSLASEVVRMVILSFGLARKRSSLGRPRWSSASPCVAIQILRPFNFEGGAAGGFGP